MHGHISTLRWLKKRITLYLSICCTDRDKYCCCFLPESVCLKKDGNFWHVKRSYSNKTTKRSTHYYLKIET